jgi:hypothetical protein
MYSMVDISGCFLVNYKIDCNIVHSAKLKIHSSIIFQVAAREQNDGADHRTGGSHPGADRFMYEILLNVLPKGM